MRKANDSPDLATETETGRLPWMRPRLQRLYASEAEHGTNGGGDTPGADMMS
jgi:hypothetical protein